MAKFCPNCMKEHTDSSTFCGSCGKSLDQKNGPGMLPVNTIVAGRYLVGACRGFQQGIGEYIALDLIKSRTVTFKEAAGSLDIKRTGNMGTELKPVDARQASQLEEAGKRLQAEGGEVFSANGTLCSVRPLPQAAPREEKKPQPSPAASPTPAKPAQKKWKAVGKKFLMTVAVIVAVNLILDGIYGTGIFSRSSSQSAGTPKEETVATPSPTPEECQHDWQSATYEQPETCSICGETRGEPLSVEYLSGEWSDSTWNFGSVSSYYYLLDEPLYGCTGISYEVRLVVVSGKVSNDQFYLHGLTTQGSWVNLGQFTMSQGSLSGQLEEYSMTFDAVDLSGFAVTGKYAETYSYYQDLNFFDPILQ